MAAQQRADDRRVSASTLAAVTDALFVGGPLTRADITDRTGLSRPSVSGAVARLLADGRIEVVADQSSTRRGRPSSLLRLSSRRAETLGIELGRHHIGMAIADASGAVVATQAREVDPATPLITRAGLAMDLVESVAAAAMIELTAARRAAIGTPGPRFTDNARTAPAAVDHARPGDFSFARLVRERAAAAQAVTERWQIPVDVDNNTRFTAMAESERRAEQGRNLVYLRLDEGVGGGIVLDGTLATGNWGAAGEIGHVSVDPGGERCPCGGRGCFELVAGLPAVLRACGAESAADLASNADRPAYAKVITGTAEVAGMVVAGVLAVINPAVLVVGGRVGLLPGFLPRLEEIARDAAPAWAATDLLVEAAHDDDLLSSKGAAAAAGRTLRAQATQSQAVRGR